MMTPEINPNDVFEILDAKDTVILDIRDERSFGQGHIPGAKNLLQDDMESFIGESNKADNYIVVCYHGNSSKAATNFFLGLGFEKVHSMSGGMVMWSSLFPNKMTDN